MAGATVSRPDIFPAGVTVGAYPRSNWPQASLPPSGVPVGAATTTAVATDSGVTFSGLADATRYFAAKSDGVGGYVAFSTPAAVLDMASQAELDAVAAAKADLASPALTGNPTVPTQTAGDSSTRAASTAFVGAAVLAGKSFAELKRSLWLPPGALDETVDRRFCTTAVALTSGTLRLNGGSVIRVGVPVTSISFWTSVGVVTPANQWACLVRESDNTVLAKTPDDLATAWAINTWKPFVFAAPYVPTADERVWLGILVVAATMPSLPATASGSVIAGVEPGPISCAANTGLTTPASLGATVTPGANAQTGHGIYS